MTMPSIDDYKPRKSILRVVETRLNNEINPPPKNFVKKHYRPWNLTGEDSNKVAIGEQLDSNKVAIGEQLDSNKVAIGEQLDSTLIANGIQKEILFYIVKKCILLGRRTSIVLQKEEIAREIKTSVGTIKNAIYRLIEKGLVRQEKGKRGKGGFFLLSITEEVKNTFEKDILNSQLDSKLGSNPPHVSSSIYINKTTTTISDSAREIVDNFSFPNEWEEIDIEPLAFIKFTKAHLDQIYKAGKISLDMLQASIHAFAFDLQVNDKTKSLKLSPLNVFMGMMKKGSPYLPPENYESPEELAMKAYHEAMKKKAERIRKLEEECKTLALQEWRDGLNEDEQKAIVPEKYHAESEKKIFDSLIFAHFEKEVWPAERGKIKTSTLER